MLLIFACLTLFYILFASELTAVFVFLPNICVHDCLQVCIVLFLMFKKSVYLYTCVCVIYKKNYLGLFYIKNCTNVFNFEFNLSYSKNNFLAPRFPFYFFFIRKQKFCLSKSLSFKIPSRH